MPDRRDRRRAAQTAVVTVVAKLDQRITGDQKASTVAFRKTVILKVEQCTVAKTEGEQDDQPAKPVHLAHFAMIEVQRFTRPSG